MPTTTQSAQPRLRNTKEVSPFVWTVWEELATDAVPEWGNPGRAQKLRDFARTEPILSGAIASMTQKAGSLNWQITGGRNRVSRYRELLAEAEDGKGWTFLLSRWLQDYLGTDTGGILELARQGKRGPVDGVYNVDAAQCLLTGSVETPVRYFPDLTTGVPGAGRSIPWGPLDFLRIVDLPTAEERRFGLGFCAVSRALKAAKILLALYNYEEERLSDMPLPGIAAITGMTQEEVKAAFDLYAARRDARQQTTFKGVLWLAAQSSPINPIEVNFTPFANLPDGFDRETVVTHYVYVLALDFGVDVREFWPASQTGATKAEAEVQAQKAKGKGFGIMLASVERALNWNVLPEGLEFLFDQKDSEDDLLREQVRAAAIANVKTLWQPAPGAGAGEQGGGGAEESPSGELRQGGDALEEQAAALVEKAAAAAGGGGASGIITTAEARRWLVELNAVPDWIAETTQTTMHGDSQAEEDTALESRTTAAIAEKARRAGLEAGEDFVMLNRAGEVATLWSSRRVYDLGGGEWRALHERIEEREAAQAQGPFWRSSGKGFDPDQPRDPAGTATGGQWTDTGAGGSGAAIGWQDGDPLPDVINSAFGTVWAQPLDDKGLALSFVTYVNGGIPNIYYAASDGYAARGKIKEAGELALINDGVSAEAANSFQEAWSSTSNDNGWYQDRLQAYALSLMSSGADVFSDAPSIELGARFLTDGSIKQDCETAYNSIAERTQAYFRDHNVGPDDEIMVFRGVKGRTFKELGVQEGDYIERPERPLSSWSLTPEIASTFAGDEGYMLAAKVRAGDIFAHWSTGFGCASEDEVVLRADKIGKVRVVKSWTR